MKNMMFVLVNFIVGLLLISGCINTKIVAHGNPAPAPCVEQICIGSYWGYWITDSPQQLLDAASQKAASDVVSTRGIYKVEVEQNVLDDVISIVSAGLVVPVSVKCWLQVDTEAEIMPIDVKHDRRDVDL